MKSVNISIFIFILTLGAFVVTDFAFAQNNKNGAGQAANTPTGGQYRGPSDTVPPNLGDPPPPGFNCLPGRPSSCSLTLNDFVAAPAYPYFPSPTWLGVQVNFGCVNGGPGGDVTEVTLGEFRSAFQTAIAGGYQYIDIYFNNSQQYSDVYMYPAKWLQVYCFQWQAYSVYQGCSGNVKVAAQTPGEFIGSPSPWIQDTCNGKLPYAVNRGFFMPPVDGCTWDDYLGQNSACVSDAKGCGNDPSKLFGVVLRVKIDCLVGIVFDIEVNNPGWLDDSMVMFSFAGKRCSGV